MTNKKEYMKKWREKNREHIREYQRARQRRFCIERPELVKAINKRYYQLHREEQLKDSKEYRRRRRLQVIEHYSNGTNACACCGEKHIEFLTIDHINNDGAEHRKKIGLGGGATYGWLVKNNYPKGYQVLCFNCNCAIGVHGYCPHKPKDWRRL